MKFNKLSKKLFVAAAMLSGLLFAGALEMFAQFTFIGDYDRANFAQPLGYYVEPQNNLPGDTTPNRQTFLLSGELNPDGSIIAGGRLLDFNYGGDFWLRKFTASGAVDTSFGGGNGYVRTTFSTDVNNNRLNSIPTILKRQADGKIVFGGICTLGQQTAAQPVGPGTDFCLVRFNADGSIDQSFGGYSFQYGNPGSLFTHTLSPGRVWIKSGINENNSIFGDFSELLDMAIQPDGKIIVVGYARALVNPFFQGAGTSRYDGVIVRFNQNGTLDPTFGINGSGIARWIPPNTGTANNPCYPQRAFYGVRLQTDGRIIAVGYDGVSNSGCFTGQVFAVTRWNQNGTLETARRLDASTDVGARERGVSALITNDGTKLLVSGAYQGSLALTRFNLSDLTLDATFGANGVVRYADQGGRALSIKAIQPDGKILAVDPNFGTSQPVRLNANGSPDNSFGNTNFDGSNPRGRADLRANTFNTTNAPIGVAQILLRPNGKIVLVGNATANEGGNSSRSFVSQNINVARPNVTSDFTNDGKADISVFRSGAWYYLNSANNSFNGASFGQAGDVPVPADYDGDGKTDVAVFRNGTWYILQSSNNQFRGIGFGASGDLPRPGDFDADGYADIAVFRPSTGTWYYLRSSTNQFVGVSFGQNGDAPLIADFDADGKSDIAVYRGGIWYYLQSSDGAFRGTSFGASGDVSTVGDYDADGKSDIAVFRPSNGFWYRINSSNGAVVASLFGQNGDRPVPADYDNDGKTDLAVFRAGNWYGLRSGDNSVFGTAFGTATDTPIPAAYLP